MKIKHAGLVTISVLSRNVLSLKCTRRGFAVHVVYMLGLKSSYVYWQICALTFV